MANDTDVLLKLWEGQWEQARHTESQRSQVGSFVISIAAAIIGFFGVYGFKETSSWFALLPPLLLAFLLTVLGIYGAITSLKLYERWKLHTKQANKWRHRIDELHPNAMLEAIKEAAKFEHESEYKRTYINSKILNIKLYKLWVVLHFMVFIIGIGLFLIVIKFMINL